MPSMAPTPGGTVLEAESANFDGGRPETEANGGPGYVDFRDAAERNWIEWSFEAPQAGTYLLELRYAAAEPRQYRSRLRVNGADAGSIVLWPTGGESTWAWDRQPVLLDKGAHRIRLEPNGPVLIDHLNVIFCDRS